MPSIEIHGYPKIGSTQVRRLTNTIWEALARAPYEGDVVITKVPSAVHDKRDVSQPFLRLYVTETEEELQDLVHRLGDITELDIEVVHLERFMSKERLRERTPARSGVEVHGDQK